ncbi:MAG: M1 family metallopeptidase [Gemmatimonadota bacterium]
MNRPLITFSALLLAATPLAAQLPERAVRRTIPITRAFARGLAAGTRDSTGRPGPRYWQLTTDYRIEASLDSATATIRGHEVVTIHNPSDSALSRIVLRLYQNLFAPNAPKITTLPEITGGITIKSLSVNGNRVDTDSAAAEWSTTTVVSIPLSTPIPPGGNGTLEADWAFRVPESPDLRGGGERMGRWGRHLFEVAQWYPQVAAYDDLKGWDQAEYLGEGEFYNNFGSFDVKLDVPAGWLVGATGVLANPAEVLSPSVRERLSHVTESDSTLTIVGKDEGGEGRATLKGSDIVPRGSEVAGSSSRLTWHFTADSVGDFAWATASDFVWDATRATIPGTGPIPVNILYLPVHSRYKTVGPFARHALEFYSALWMPYRFPQFTQVDGPEGGMEYPMLTMSGPWFGVTDHEIGHQWWPMMVANNETQYGWMDEGFNQYMNILSGANFEKRAAVLDSVGQGYGKDALVDDQATMMWDSNHSGDWYGFVTYSKAPMMFSALGGVVGDSAVVRAMSEYAHSWRGKHPSPWDFMFGMNRSLGRDLGWFWYYWLFTTETVDGSIQKVETRAGTTRVTVRQEGEMPAPVVLRVEFAADGPAVRPMKNAVITGNSATVTWPVDVWFAGSRTFVASLNFGRRKIERITLDPGHRFPDRNASDNVWPR